LVGPGPDKADDKVGLRTPRFIQKKRFSARQALEHPFFQDA